MNLLLDLVSNGMDVKTRADEISFKSHGNFNECLYMWAQESVTYVLTQ